MVSHSLARRPRVETNCRVLEASLGRLRGSGSTTRGHREDAASVTSNQQPALRHRIRRQADRQASESAASLKKGQEHTERERQR